MRKNGRKIWTYIHPNNKKSLFMFLQYRKKKQQYMASLNSLYILIPNERNFVYYFIPSKHLWFYKTNLLIRG